MFQCNLVFHESFEELVILPPSKKAPSLPTGCVIEIQRALDEKKMIETHKNEARENAINRKCDKD